MDPGALRIAESGTSNTEILGSRLIFGIRSRETGGLLPVAGCREKPPAGVDTIYGDIYNNEKLNADGAVNR